MDRIMAVVLNHRPTSEQVEELKKLKYDYVFIQHPPIPPEWDMVMVSAFAENFDETEVAKTIYNATSGLKSSPDGYWIQGDFRFFKAYCDIAELLRKPLYVATTERIAEEQIQPDGSIRKVSIFKHIKFVRVV